MAVYHIRLESDHRKRRKCRITEERKLLQVIKPVSIWLWSVKIAFIVNKLKCNSLMYILKDAHITTLSQIVHIEVVNILHLVPPFLLDAQIFWDNDSYIKVSLVKTLWK